MSARKARPAPAPKPAGGVSLDDVNVIVDARDVWEQKQAAFAKLFAVTPRAACGRMQIDGKHQAPTAHLAYQRGLDCSQPFEQVCSLFSGLLGQLLALHYPLGGDGREVEVSTADVVVGDLVVIRPGNKIPARIRQVERMPVFVLDGAGRRPGAGQPVC